MPPMPPLASCGHSVRRQRSATYMSYAYRVIQASICEARVSTSARRQVVRNIGGFCRLLVVAIPDARIIDEESV